MGMLHDLDYERHPDMDAADGHPRTGMAELERLGFTPEFVRAVASHADYLDVAARERRWRRRSTPSTSCRAS